jgi:hypothetical protein
VKRIIENDLSELEPRLSRHQVLLGHEPDGKEYSLHPFRSNVLIAGTQGGGKSTAAMSIVERLVEKQYQVCVIDPEGDYGELEGVISIGTAQQPPSVEAVMKLLTSSTQSVIVNLLALPIQGRPHFFLSLLARLQELRARVGRPHWIVVDEAHHVWPTNWTPGERNTPQHLDRTLFITRELNLLSQATLKTIDLVLATGKSPDKTLGMFAAAVGLPYPRGDFPDLNYGETLVWETSPPQPPKLIKIAAAGTLRHRHIRKYAESELKAD